MGPGETTLRAEPDTFLRRGYVVLRHMLSPAEIDTLRSAVHRVLDTGPGETCARPHNTLAPLRWDSPIVGLVVADGERITRLTEAVGGHDLRWISGYVSTKDPRSLPLWWHQDWWCWNHPVTFRRQPVQVAVLCSLTDTDEHHGALRVLPGSHALSTSLHGALPEAHDLALHVPDRRNVAMDDQWDQVTLDLRAGDAAVLDYRILHGTHPHTGSFRRDAVLLSFAPSWAELPPDIRGHLISHPSLPTVDELHPTTGWAASLLPTYEGPRRDLPLVRDAPARFAIDGALVCPIAVETKAPLPPDGDADGPDSLRAP